MKRLEIKAIKETDDMILLELNEELFIDAEKSFKAAQRMLADSDRLSFIYLLEDEEDTFVYVSIGKDLWPELAEKIKTKEPFFVQLTNTNIIELEGFYEELNYLLDNIKDNSNYGEEMVLTVEKCFY